MQDNQTLSSVDTLHVDPTEGRETSQAQVSLGIQDGRIRMNSVGQQTQDDEDAEEKLKLITTG